MVSDTIQLQPCFATGLASIALGFVTGREPPVEKPITRSVIPLERELELLDPSAVVSGLRARTTVC